MKPSSSFFASSSVPSFSALSFVASPSASASSSPSASSKPQLPPPTTTAAATNHFYSYSPQSSPITKNFIPNNDEENEKQQQQLLARHNTSSSSADYERIRIVGKGSFGMAVLYRRKEDDSFVIIKEINLHELSPSERQMSLNEVRLLSRLDHPHIIAFYDSFEEEGTLMIEMEYADGGTLAQFLARQSEPLAELVVMDMFEQMSSAVSYLHDNAILHRDLKTANIFLTRERMVKVGDFGISKKMGTQTLFQGAQTILGTPYYLSPEMCEGKPYNEKSDIWALGCCLYEMCMQRKAFDADNLPTLIHKIINSEYEPMSSKSGGGGATVGYSQDVRLLVRDLLRTAPEQRPTAAKVLEQVRRFRSLADQKSSLLLGLDAKARANLIAKKGGVADATSVGTQFSASISASSTTATDALHSALYRFDVMNCTLSAVQELPGRVQIQQIAISPTHQLLLTGSGRVHSWGENRFGQLGHGDRRRRTLPTQIEALEGRFVSRVAAGRHFSLFCVGRGIVMAAGHRQFVGIGANGEDLTRPKIVDTLLTEDIVDICCGDEHCAALTENGTVFVWGKGENGRLGTGDTKHVLVPTRIQIPTRQLINSIVCGPNATMLITNSGTVLAMGSNRHNKLLLNERVGGFFKELKKNLHPPAGAKVENVLVPSAIKPFPSRVVSAALGANHTGVLLENGHVHLFGLNSSGELGTGNSQPMPPNCCCNRPVKSLMAKACVHLICGNGFTMVGTLDNEIYFWGKKGGNATDDGEGGDGSGPDGSGQQQQQTSAGIMSAAKRAPVLQMERTQEGWQLSVQSSVNMTILQPFLLLRLDICRSVSAGPGGQQHQQQQQQPFIALTGLVCCENSVLCVVDVSRTAAATNCSSSSTSNASASAKAHGSKNEAALMKQQPKKQASISSSHEQQQQQEEWAAGGGDGIKERRMSAPEQLDTWIMQELEEAEFIPYNKMNGFGEEKRRTNGMQRGEQPSSSTSMLLMMSERKLREEIEQLRLQLQEQKSTFRRHQKQMAQLQAKLAELQHLLMRRQTLEGGGGVIAAAAGVGGNILALPPVNIPPPEYPGSGGETMGEDGAPPSMLPKRNTFLQADHVAASASRTCAIL